MTHVPPLRSGARRERRERRGRRWPSVIASPSVSTESPQDKSDKPPALDEIVESLSKASSQLSKVKLPGGVVGKVTLAIMVFVVAAATMAWSVRNVWVTGVALGLSFIAFVLVSFRLIRFAERHPQAALMEGAEFLMHEHIQLRTKSRVALSPGDATTDPPNLPALPSRDTVDLPDDKGDDAKALDAASAPRVLPKTEAS